MRFLFVVAAAAALVSACSHDFPKPGTITQMHQWNDWQHERGEKLYAALANDVSRIARRSGRAETISQLQAAGYECIFGEAHEDYPEPAARCTRSFATRACQFDWVVFLTSAAAKPDRVESTDVSFRRDCVSTAQDWPEPVNSAIGDQLAAAGPF